MYLPAFVFRLGVLLTFFLVNVGSEQTFQILVSVIIALSLPHYLGNHSPVPDIHRLVGKLGHAPGFAAHSCHALTEFLPRRTIPRIKIDNSCQLIHCQ